MHPSTHHPHPVRDPEPPPPSTTRIDLAADLFDNTAAATATFTQDENGIYWLTIAVPFKASPIPQNESPGSLRQHIPICREFAMGYHYAPQSVSVVPIKLDPTDSQGMTNFTITAPVPIKVPGTADGSYH